MLDIEERSGPVLHTHRSKESLKAIEVALRDRIVLMIVAARTAHRETEKHLSDGSGDLVENVLPELRFEVRIRFPRSHPQETQCDEPLRAIPALHLVARQLFFDECVVRLVLIHRSNHIVAIPPCGRTLSINRETVGFREAREIQPVTRPSLTVSGIRQQPVDDLLVSIRGGVLLERFYFGWSWRHTDQVEVDTSKQRALRRRRSRFEALRFELRQYERIDRIFDPARIVHSGLRWSNRFVQEPVDVGIGLVNSGDRRVHFIDRFGEDGNCLRVQTIRPSAFSDCVRPRTYCSSSDCPELPGERAAPCLPPASTEFRFAMVSPPDVFVAL